MSTLIYDELSPGVVFEQKFKIQKNVNIAHIRPWIYVQGVLVDGDLTLEVLQGANSLITKSIPFSDINSAMLDTYNHGFIRFDYDSLSLQIPEGLTEEEYTIKLSMENHSLDTTNYVAMVRNWDIKIYDTYGDVDGSGQGVNDMIEPGGLEIFYYKK